MNAHARSQRFGFAISTLALVLVAACGSESLQPAEAITGLHFTAATEIPANPPPDVDVTLTDPTPSRAIYGATLALPVYPPGAYSCPNDWGVRYSIVFRAGQSDATTAVLNPTGCAEVTISGSSTRRAIDPIYWMSLAENLGIPQAAIYPLPHP
jgi:hypothetical protein